MSEDRCVICGAYVPEGRMICPNCEAGKKTLINDGGFHKPIIFEPTITKDECPKCKRSFKDFVKVVRCKDCKWSNDDCSECMNPNLALGGDYTSCLYIDPDWFCAGGEQKEETELEKRPMKNLSHGEMVQIAEGRRKPMPRYIDAEPFKLWVQDTYVLYDGNKYLKDIDEQPTADVVERKKGKWNWVSFNIECSECGAMPNFDSTEPLYNFCPNCGADMRGETNAEVR